MRKVYPLVTRNHANQILLDLSRFVVLCEFESPRDSVNVRIHDHAFGLSIPRAEDDVGGFAGCARNRDQLRQFLGHLTAKFIHNFLRCANQRSGFVSEESRGADLWFELFWLDRGKVLWRW